MCGSGLEPGLAASVVPENPAGGAAAARLLRSSRRPTAIVHTSDRLALAALGVALHAGFEVPGDLAIARFGTSPHRRLTWLPVTTVRVHYGGFGEAAAARLLPEIDGAARPRLELAPPR